MHETLCFILTVTVTVVPPKRLYDFAIKYKIKIVVNKVVW